MNLHKKTATASRFVQSKPEDSKQLNGTDHQQAASLLAGESKGRWLPVVIVSIYFAMLWKPPLISVPSLRWYFVLGLALFAFVVLKKSISMRAARVFWIVYGLSFFGAVLSLLRAIDAQQALWNTVGMGISFVSYLLFLPVLAIGKARQFLMWMLVSIGILWAIEILRLLAQHSVLYLGTFGETGADKNHIGFCLSMSSIVLFYLSVFWKPSKILSRGVFFVIRLGLGLLSILLIYCLVIIYARSGLLATVLGICTVIGVILIKNPGWLGRSRAGVVIVILIASVIFLLPRVLAASPQWNRLSNYDTEGLNVISTYNIRTVLLNKGLFLVSENPVLGVGVGGSKFAISSSQYYFPYYLIHNTFLTDWAEKGVLGLLSNVVWIFMYIGILKKDFFNLQLIDQIWLVLFIPLFFEMNFLDMNSISVFMLAILAGINVESVSSAKLKQPAYAPRYGRMVINR